jgi:uncharacterized protein with NRDE domain
MCTLIVFSRIWPEARLVVAANRDENLDRKSGPPGIWPEHALAFFAPRDLSAGGTWLGLNSCGLFAGITNRFGSTPPDPDRRSRGLLVVDALQEKNGKAVVEMVMALPPKTYNRFHLVLADEESVYLVYSDGSKLTKTELGSGIHVITERSLGAASGSREAMLKSRSQVLVGRALPDKSSLVDLLSIHADDPFDGSCVHAPAFNYGTRSSTLIWQSAGLRWLHSEGSPCKTSYLDYSKKASEILA